MKNRAVAVSIAAILGIGVCVAAIANSTKPVAKEQKRYALLLKNGDVVQALSGILSDDKDAVGYGEIHTVADPEHPAAFREVPQVTARACYDRRTGSLVSNKSKTGGSIQCVLAVFEVM